MLAPTLYWLSEGYVIQVPDLSQGKTDFSLHPEVGEVTYTKLLRYATSYFLKVTGDDFLTLKIAETINYNRTFAFKIVWRISSNLLHFFLKNKLHR